MQHGIYSEDVFVTFEEEETVVKVYGLEDEINKIDLLEGRLPEAQDECVIEDSMRIYKNVNIGDFIDIKENLEDDESSSFYNTKLKVVGIVESPLYISRDRGTTTLGSGKISYYIYVNKENINSETFTEVDITVDGAKELSELSKKYTNKISKVEDELETIKEERQNARYTELINEANKNQMMHNKNLKDKRKMRKKKFKMRKKKFLMEKIR